MSDRPMPAMPKPDAASTDAFRSLVPDDERIAVRPMFGNVAAFVNGNMFMGLFGADLFVRLPEDARATVMAEGGAMLEPMPGRPMREYVTLPGDWRERTDVRAWVRRALDSASQLPPKVPRSTRR